MWSKETTARFSAAKKRGGYLWSALFQQRPVPEEGVFFKTEDIGYYDPSEINLAGLSIYITSDYAVTEDSGSNDPDYTVHTVWGIDSEFNIYMLDMWRGRTLSDEWVNQFIRLVKGWRPIMAGEEQGQIIKGVGPFLKRQMMTESAFVARRQYVSSTSKVSRAQGIIGMVAMGKFFLPRGHPMTELFRAELIGFPNVKHDDMVDTASLMANMLDQIISGQDSDPEERRDQTLGEMLAENERRQNL